MGKQSFTIFCNGLYLHGEFLCENISLLSKFLIFMFHLDLLQQVGLICRILKSNLHLAHLVNKIASVFEM